MLPIVAVLVALQAPAADGPSKPVAPQTAPAAGAEYKVVFGYYELKKEPIAAGELVAGRGKLYQFLEGSAEVIVIDPARRSITILDLRRQAMAVVGFAEVEEGVAAIRKEMRESIAELEKKGTRADRVAADIERDQLETRFRATYDEPEHRLRLANACIQVESVGEPEPDEARLVGLGKALVLLTELRAIRAADSLAPFAKVEAIEAMVAGRKLRPTEMTFVFRLAGPPKKYRWTYKLTPTITDREREALARIDDLLGRTRRLDLDRYDRLLEADEIQPRVPKG